MIALHPRDIAAAFALLAVLNLIDRLSYGWAMAQAGLLP